MELLIEIGTGERKRTNDTDSTLVAVPVNLKEQDAFHLTIEEYLLALISMVEELV